MGSQRVSLSLKKLSSPKISQDSNYIRLGSSTCFNTCQNLLAAIALSFQDVLIKISRKKERALTLPCATLHHPYLFTTFDFRQQLVCVDSASTIAVHIPPLLLLHWHWVMTQVLGYVFPALLPFKVSKIHRNISELLVECAVHPLEACKENINLTIYSILCILFTQDDH